MIRRLFRRLFPVDRRGECGTWRRGELAVCLVDRWELADPANPVRGDLLRVSRVDDAIERGERFIFLQFEGKPAGVAWSAAAFRKAVRDDVAAADARFIASLKPARAPLLPARQPEPVA